MDDLSLLLSTTATASAALIAIVGGLLVARVVSLATERLGLLHRRDDARVQVEHARGRAADLAQRKLDWEASWILDAFLDELAALPERPDLDRMLRETLSGRTAEEIQPYVDGKLAQLRYVREQLEPLLAHGPPRGTVSALDYQGAIDVPAGQLDDYEAVWAQLKSEHARPGAPEPLVPLHNFATNADRVGHELRLQSEKGAFDQLSRDAEAADHRLAEREAELAQVEAALIRVSHPAGVGWGVAVLSYFALVGVLFPLTLLLNPTGQPGWMAAVVIGLFASGMVGLLAYIVVTVRRLGRGTHE